MLDAEEFDCNDEALAEQCDDETLDAALVEDDDDLDSQTEDEAPSTKSARENNK